MRTKPEEYDSEVKSQEVDDDKNVNKNETGVVDEDKDSNNEDVKEE